MLVVIVEDWARDNDALRWDSDSRHGKKRVCKSALDTKKNLFLV